LLLHFPRGGHSKIRLSEGRIMHSKIKGDFNV